MIKYWYDGKGRRIKKGNITFTYDCEGNLIKQSNGLEFFYDSQGVAGFVYGSNSYYYKKDALGDIIAILDATGVTVTSYVYNVWGEHSISGNMMMGELNPFRYRSYYYDTETCLYYLQTRYYDPVTCRFLNMDSIDYADPSSIGGLNLYAYCNNDPVNNIDPTGHAFLSIFLGSLIVGTVLGAIKGAIQSAWNGEPIWKGALIEGLKGLVLGGALGLGGAIGMATSSVVAAFGGLIFTAAGSFAAGMGIYALETQIYDREFSQHDMLLSGLNLSLQASANYGAGYLFGRKRMFKQKAKLNFSSWEMFFKSLIFRVKYALPVVVERAYLKLGLATIFSMIVNGIIQDFYYNR